MLAAVKLIHITSVVSVLTMVNPCSVVWAVKALTAVFPVVTVPEQAVAVTLAAPVDCTGNVPALLTGWVTAEPSTETNPPALTLGTATRPVAVPSVVPATSTGAVDAALPSAVGPITIELPVTTVVDPESVWTPLVVPGVV